MSTTAIRIYGTMKPAYLNGQSTDRIVEAFRTGGKASASTDVIDIAVVAEREERVLQLAA